MTKNRRRALLRTLILFLLFLLPPTHIAIGQENNQTPVPAASTRLPSIEELKACMRGAASAECLDKIFREALKKHSTLEALQLIQRYEAQDADLRRDCHPIVHAIGRETFLNKGTIHDSFTACDQTCHSGCYHGSVERFLRGDDIYSQTEKHPTQSELKQKAALACDPNAPVRLRFQCLHGLGHALLFFSQYKLQMALSACDGLPEAWSQTSCYGGIFMENVSNATPERRDLSPTDYHYPCNQLEPKYRGECYVMQTSRMTEMGLSTQRVLEECEKTGEYRSKCTVSAGRDLSNFVRLGQTRETAQKCELASGELRHACIRGVIYALIDNTWDGRYAWPFCAALGQDADRDYCLKDSIYYLKTTFAKPPEEIIKECSRQFGQPEKCAALPAR